MSSEYQYIPMRGPKILKKLTNTCNYEIEENLTIFKKKCPPENRFWKYH